MSKAERQARAEAQLRADYEAWERERAKLAPKPCAVIICAVYGYFPQTWRSVEFSRRAFEGAQGIQCHSYPATRSPA